MFGSDASARTVAIVVLLASIGAASACSSFKRFDAGSTGADVPASDASDALDARNDSIVATDAIDTADAATTVDTHDVALDVIETDSCPTSCAAVPAPRPIAPLSTNFVTTNRPTLHWSLASGTDGAHVEICRDRACATTVTSFDASGASGTVTSPLDAGAYYWRLAGRACGCTGTATGPVWQFTVGRRDTPVDSSWIASLDVNGDGFSDVVVGDFGSAHLYLGSASGLSSTSTTLTWSGILHEAIGVANGGDLNGDGFGDVIVSDSSTAGVFLGSDAGPQETTTLLLAPPMSRTFDSSFAGTGDVNGDGYGDALVSGYQSDAAFVFLGSPAGLSTSPTVLMDSSALGFGKSVAALGDVNGDGYADVAVGADSANEIILYMGSASGLGGPTPIMGPTGAARFGYAVGGATDLNGDGFADAIVGAWNSDGAYLYFGGPAGLGATPTPIVRPATNGFGISVAGVGDTDGDGFGDAVVGADPSNTAVVILGGLDPSMYRSTTINGPSTGGFGSLVSSTTDVNGDGYADVLVSSYYTAQAFLYLGASGGIHTSPSPTVICNGGIAARSTWTGAYPTAANTVCDGSIERTHRAESRSSDRPRRTCGPDFVEAGRDVRL